MKKIEFAHEILSESRRSTQIYLESSRDYDKVKANMYSVFECYAHGLITWNQVRSRWHSSILEYLNLYASKPDLYLSESNRMLGEYENTLNTYKPALDEYKRVNEQKMTSNIVIKGKLNESQAKEHSKIYFNRRALKESELKDTATMKTWKQVQESYPNLTSKDELRIRMLTVFEGSTVDTTKLVTTYMSEEPTAISGPMQTSMRPKPRPVTGGVNAVSIDAAVQQALGQDTAPTTSPRPMPRPAGQSIGAGSQVAYMDNGAVDGSTRGIDPVDAYSPEDLARLTGQPAPSLAPTTSPRPMPRPTTLKQSANNNIRKEAAAIFNKIKVAANEGYKVLPPMDKERYTEIPGLEGPFTTLSGKVVYYDPKEGAYYDRDTDMYLSNDEYTALNSDYSGMRMNRESAIGEADAPLAHPNYMDTKNNPEILSAFEKQRQNWLKTNPRGGEVDDLNDLVNFGNKVSKVGNPKAAATLTKGSMDYFKNNPGRGLGEAAKPDFLDMDKDGDKEEPMKKAVTDSKKKVDEKAKTLDEAASFKLKVTNPATGNSETQEFNSETALKDYTARAKQHGLKVSRINEANTSLNEGYSDRVQQIADRVNKSYPDGVTRNEVNKLITQFAYDQVEMRGSEKAKRDFIKDVASKINTKRDTSKSDAANANKEKILSYLATAIETAVGNSMPDGDPWDAISVKGRKAGIDPDNLLKYLDLAARKHLGSKGYYDYLRMMWDAYGAGDFGNEPEANWENPWKAESIGEAVTLDYSRYMRAHGKKPRDSGMGSSTWMFTTSEFGEPGEDEVFQFQGNFADAKKAAAKWAKSRGEYRFYAMEDAAPKVNEQQTITEAQFDEAAGEKDACYHKVKSRYKVWPSAYASGALSKCRKVGASNWGKSKE